MQKRDRYKKVNISVLIVKIIPGQEFTSNHFSLACVPPRPSQDHPSSLLSNLLSLALPDEAKERGAALLYLQQQTTVKSNRRVDCGQPAPSAPSCSKPRGADRRVFCRMHQRPPACSQARSEVIRPLGCSGASVCKVGPFFQLVKVNKLDQVRKSGVSIVKAEECLPIILAR